jgi:predicted secreted hydrolase
MSPFHATAPRIPFLAALLSFAMILPLSATEWRKALPGWDYQFPRDHSAHPDFKTEWWYFTGHLESTAGAKYGFQLTFFRQGLIPPEAAAGSKSRFVRSGFHFAHFAISDLGREKFHFTQKLSRGAFDEAGNGIPGDPLLAWIDDWQLRLLDDETFAFRAEVDGIELDLKLRNTKPVVLNGENGVSQKAAGAGEATHYYALTRMEGSGSLLIDGEPQAVTAEAWFDREWGSNQLGVGQVGWDWFSLQLDDGRELMLYQLRNSDGTADSHSAGTLTAKDGTTTYLSQSDFTLTPKRHWKSKRTGGKYPLEWQIKAPNHLLDLSIEAEFDKQELALKPVPYWEGAVSTSGSHPGRGYLEMTGYAAPLKALQR